MLTVFLGNNTSADSQVFKQGACSRCKRRKSKCEFIPEQGACRTCISNGLANECTASQTLSKTRSISCERHIPPAASQQSSHDGLDSREHPNRLATETRSGSSTRSTNKKSGPPSTQSLSKSVQPDRPRRRKHVLETEEHSEDEELQPKTRTYRGHVDKLRKANPKLPAVQELDEEDSVVIEERITTFGKVMAGEHPAAHRNAHKKARSFFKGTSDSDLEYISLSEDDTEGSGESTERSDDEVEEIVRPMKKSLAAQKVTKTIQGRSRAGKQPPSGRERSRSRVRESNEDEYDPETCGTPINFYNTTVR
jgi:hypothetical protein